MSATRGQSCFLCELRKIPPRSSETGINEPLCCFASNSAFVPHFASLVAQTRRQKPFSLRFYPLLRSAEWIWNNKVTPFVQTSVCFEKWN
ncbi:MAG: hypothetical protein ACTS42_02090 [Candidatus Hodgkinia cicadicola]